MTALPSHDQRKAVRDREKLIGSRSFARMQKVIQCKYFCSFYTPSPGVTAQHALDWISGGSFFAVGSELHFRRDPKYTFHVSIRNPETGIDFQHTIETEPFSLQISVDATPRRQGDDLLIDYLIDIRVLDIAMYIAECRKLVAKIEAVRSQIDTILLCDMDPNAHMLLGQCPPPAQTDESIPHHEFLETTVYFQAMDYVTVFKVSFPVFHTTGLRHSSFGILSPEPDAQPCYPSFRGIIPVLAHLQAIGVPLRAHLRGEFEIAGKLNEALDAGSKIGQIYIHSIGESYKSLANSKTLSSIGKTARLANKVANYLGPILIFSEGIYNIHKSMAGHDKIADDGTLDFVMRPAITASIHASTVLERNILSMEALCVMATYLILSDLQAIVETAALEMELKAGLYRIGGWWVSSVMMSVLGLLLLAEGLTLFGATVVVVSLGGAIICANNVLSDGIEKEIAQMRAAWHHNLPNELRRFNQEKIAKSEMICTPDGDAYAFSCVRDCRAKLLEPLYAGQIHADHTFFWKESQFGAPELAAVRMPDIKARPNLDLNTSTLLGPSITSN